MYEKTLLDSCRKIEGMLEDEVSKLTFQYRLLANLSGDVRYIHSLLSEAKTIDFKEAYEMYRKIDETYHIYPRLDVLSFIQTRKNEKPIVLFGAGHDAEIYLSLLMTAGIAPSAIIDNYTEKKELSDIPVFKPEKYEPLKDSIAIITSMKNCNAMYWELRARGLDDEAIFVPDKNALYIFSQKEYFDTDIWSGMEDEIYVDGGAYNLSTVNEFTRFSKSCKRIIAFEPDDRNLELCKEAQKSAQIKNLEIIHAGLWNKDGELRFRRGGDNGTGTSVCDDTEDTIRVPVRSLDSVLGGEKCTFIKLDIEGSELKALEGARETIKKYKPRLAICLYHKPEDLIQIPLYIKALVPEYKMKIRHYSTWFFDTILYAYID